MYTDDELLMLSGIQHFLYCPRQWALGHIHQLWADNQLTAEGEAMHARVDDFSLFESREQCIKIHALPITSYLLGLTGIADIIELEPTSDSVNAILHPKRIGFWLPHPVEFKHGTSKVNDYDRAQVCAQAMCLEETYSINISIGYIFYGKMRHREIVECDAGLRALVVQKADEMHNLLITYDVNTEEKDGVKRLRQVAKLCINHGQRVQNSVFECLLEQAEFVRLKNAINLIIDNQKDSVRFYLLGKNWKRNIEYLGKQTAFDIDDVLIV